MPILTDILNLKNKNISKSKRLRYSLSEKERLSCNVKQELYEQSKLILCSCMPRREDIAVLYGFPKSNKRPETNNLCTLLTETGHSPTCCTGTRG